MSISDWSSDVCSSDLKPAKLDKVVADKVPRASGFKVLILRRAMLVRAHDKCGVHADCGCCRQIIIMGCEQDALRWLQAENIRRVEIALRIGLVAANDFGSQNAVPRKPRALGHVRQQADVPVRQRSDQEPRAEQVQSLDGIRPWIQPMPCHVKVQQRPEEHTHELKSLMRSP